MKPLALFTLAALAAISSHVPAASGAAPSAAAVEYEQHFDALSKLSIEVAEAMPPEQYAFRPDPPSMTFGELMVHIAQANFAFCYGLRDSNPPAPPSVTGKDPIVGYLTESFAYCAAVIPALTDQQLNTPHPSPDGRLLGREILLAFYIHVAHHRGQAEIYLRDKGITPPRYII